MSLKLSETEIRRRLQEGRNYKRLYTELKVRFDKLEAEHRECPKRIAALQSRLDNQAIQIAELQALVFGKKKRPPSGTAAPALPGPAPGAARTAASYRRPVPPAEAVSRTAPAPLPPACPHCGSKAGFAGVTAKDRYIEDIPLPELTPGYRAKLVTKYVVERGVCRACGKTASGRSLGGAAVSLGPNVRLLVTDLAARLGMSYSQICQLLLALYGLALSDGEVANLIQAQHQAWLPAYNRLKADIRAAPAKHYDETPWHIQGEDNAGYAWVAADAASEAVCFALASSRGARHARELHGDSRGVRITDGYAAYQSLPGPHQLCWAHPLRKLRDLAGCTEVPTAQRPYVEEWYAGFAGVYAALRRHLAEPYDKPKRLAAASSLWSQLQQLIRTSPGPAGEPTKLTKLKAQLIRAGKGRLLVCLPAMAPCDNNRAERALRQLVLKRKRSFGSKTEKGATALATILSLCTTTWRRAQGSSNPAGYFTRLAALAG